MYACIVCVCHVSSYAFVRICMLLRFCIMHNVMFFMVQKANLDHSCRISFHMFCDYQLQAQGTMYY